MQTCKAASIYHGALPSPSGLLPCATSLAPGQFQVMGDLFIFLIIHVSVLFKAKLLKF